MPSPLDFNNIDTAFFRTRCLTKNLAPYPKSPNRPQPPVNTEYTYNLTPVVDSPDALIDTPIFADQAYPRNQFGPEGGYKQVPDPNALLNTKSNEGEYGPLQQDAKILGQSVYEVQQMRSRNAYGDGTLQIVDAGLFVESLERPEAYSNLYNNQPYPTTFNPSSYSPYNILLQQDPAGSDGLLSQDSFLAALGAKSLKKDFLDRIAAQIRRQTIGRANLFNANSGTDILGMVTGRIPLIEPNYTITVPQTPILASSDFALRLAGSILPVSTIPGSYFDPSINVGQPTTIQQLTQAVTGARSALGNFFTRLLGGTKTGSQLFLENTGSGTRTRLFLNLDYNKYKPNYDRGVFDRLGGQIVGTVENNSNYYIGSTTSDPSRILSPGGDLPVDQFGREQQSPVYGPSEIAQLYEGPNQQVKLGPNAPTYIDGGGIEGGFTWVSPKYKDNAGKKVGLGGEITEQDENFRPSSYNSTESTNNVFREGSILYDTQKLIDSQPQGGRRLQHVGNAIDQVSKVFNDGYKEMTKGSRVYRYIGAIGQEVGTEYCRVFAKDLPYLEYSDLQKTDGVTTAGRKFASSVLDKTYNLNIAPNKREGGQDSTNLVLDTASNVSLAKKYMFSLENLAWRTSSTPGFSVSELPVCERGINGGRVMWFPPYDLKFNESVTANWKPQDFIGRPEPIYTYTNTTRTGTLSWKIVVDHPSVLNVIVDKVLGKETNKTRINGILESFFAGCRKYDLYELAKKYYTISPSDLYELQQIISSKEPSKETVTQIINQTATGNNTTGQPGGDNGTPSPVKSDTDNTPNQTKKITEEIQGLALYFSNARPLAGEQVEAYPTYYNYYVSKRSEYANKGQALANFFDTVITPNYEKVKSLLVEIGNTLKSDDTSTVRFDLVASASAPDDEASNLSLGERRYQSVEKFILEDPNIKKAHENGKVSFNSRSDGESGDVKSFVSEEKGFLTKAQAKCTSKTDINGNVYDGIFSVQAMACRRTTIAGVKITTTKPPPAPPPTIPPIVNEVGGGNNPPYVPPRVPPRPQFQIEQRVVTRDNITKRVLRALISECDYFETIKEETPMVYDNLKDKLKFFQPAFHSTTPEGLNSRLTFLQQCMRPGDTIPTIKEINGATSLQYNNATNTAFGTPPVLVLRIGDFYNTKIIPTSLSLTFEGLDINPEGIGVQPMIANVSMNFNFVGGSGLSQAVDKLQNALTFNYYANTEMWDDRADVTDDSIKVLDKNFLQSVGVPPPPLANQVENYYTFSNLDTIGKRSKTVITSTTEDGEMSYKEFMDNFRNDTGNYFQNIFNKEKQIVQQYNNAMLQLWSLERLYRKGKFEVTQALAQDTYLFGKPDNIQKIFDKFFVDYEAAINTTVPANQDGFINFINKPNKGFTDKTIKQIKRNYSNFIKAKKSNFLTAIFSIIQETTNLQQKYLQYLGRVNTITIQASAPSTGTDGYQEENMTVRIFETSGTTAVSAGSTASNTLDEMIDDIKKIEIDLNAFDLKTVSKVKFDYKNKSYDGWLVYGQDPTGGGYTAPYVIGQVFIPFSNETNIDFTNSDFTNTQFRRMYLFCSQDLKDDNYPKFKEAIIGNIKTQPDLTRGGADFRQIEIEFDAYWKTMAKNTFDKETETTNAFLDYMEKTESELKNFLNYNPFPSKERVLTYSLYPNPLDTQTTMIKSLGASSNYTTNKQTWNDLIGANSWVSKIKLN